MSAVDQFWIDVSGKQTHGARPWSGVDPIVASAQIITGIQSIISRQSNIALEPAVVTVGAINGGNRMNIIPDKVSMLGTIRTYDEGMKKDIHKRLATTAEHIAESSGAKAKVKVVELYNAVVNPPDLVARMGPTLERGRPRQLRRAAQVLGLRRLFVLPAGGARHVLLPGRDAQDRTRTPRQQPLAAVLCR